MALKDVFQSITQFFDLAQGIKNRAKRAAQDVEAAAARMLRKIRRALIKTVLELIFLVLSVVLLLVGIILFANRYISLDIILIVAGFLSFYVALLLRWTK